MSHSHVWCLIHVVFGTAERQPTIYDGMTERVHGYLGGIARENGIPALAIGGTPDHVHLLLSLPRTVSVAKVVQLLKSGSSKWIHENYPGYGTSRGKKDTELSRSESLRRRTP